jgi:hypothetical protein
LNLGKRIISIQLLRISYHNPMYTKSYFFIDFSSNFSRSRYPRTFF